MKTTRRLMVGACILNLYDAAITIYATQHLGLAEGNPLMGFLLATSAILFVLVKILVLGVICRTLHRRYAARPKTTWSMSVGLFLSFLIVGVWNTIIVLMVINHQSQGC